MIIGGILTFFIALISFIVGFAEGYGIGYLDKQDDEKEKTGDVHEQRGENFTMEQDSSWTNSLNDTRF